jgi:uncharacterized surface protein with fasciclin (FAS1) repeats
MVVPVGPLPLLDDVKEGDGEEDGDEKMIVATLAEYPAGGGTGTGGFSTMVAAFHAHRQGADGPFTLDGDGTDGEGFTVFAPTDDAFAPYLAVAGPLPRAPDTPPQE